MAKYTMKDCTAPHPTLHAITGLGAGLLLVGLFSALGGQTGVVLGIILIVAGFAGHYMVK